MKKSNSEKHLIWMVCIVILSMWLGVLGLAAMCKAADKKVEIVSPPIVNQPAPPAPSAEPLRKVGEGVPLPVDRNVFEAGEGLCSNVAEWVGEERYFAGHEGGEDVISCRWWKLGKVGEEPVIMWRCKDGNSKWVVLCGNTHWWNGEE